jgi:hypothetical protein
MVAKDNAAQEITPVNSVTFIYDECRVELFNESKNAVPRLAPILSPLSQGFECPKKFALYTLFGATRFALTGY